MAQPQAKWTATVCYYWAFALKTTSPSPTLSTGKQRSTKLSGYTQGPNTATNGTWSTSPLYAGGISRMCASLELCGEPSTGRTTDFWGQPSVHSAFNTARLKHPCCRNQFQEGLDKKLTQHGRQTGGTTRRWDQFMQIVTETARSTLGPKRRVHQDWFGKNQEEICTALQEKNKAFITW